MQDFVEDLLGEGVSCWWGDLVREADSRGERLELSTVA